VAFFFFGRQYWSIPNKRSEQSDLGAKDAAVELSGQCQLTGCGLPMGLLLRAGLRPMM
jgi:hypothetical protein